MIKGNGGLHVLVLSVGITMAQQHHLVMVCEVVVGYGDGRRSVDRIDQPVAATRQRAVINPDVSAREYRHPVAIRHQPMPRMAGRVPYNSTRPRLTVMDMETMNDNVRRIVYRDARAAGDMDAGAAAVDRLERVHHELFLQRDHHVSFEDDPQRFVLYHSVSQCPGPRVYRIIITRVTHHVNSPVFPSNRVLPEPNSAVG